MSPVIAMSPVISIANNKQFNQVSTLMNEYYGAIDPPYIPTHLIYSKNFKKMDFTELDRFVTK